MIASYIQKIIICRKALKNSNIIWSYVKMNQIKVSVSISENNVNEINQKIAFYKNQRKHDIGYLYTILNIHQEAKIDFEKIATSGKCIIKGNNYFDLYKISKFFGIQPITNKILSLYDEYRLTFDQIADQICFLHKRLISNIETKYFDDFLESSNTILRFSENINKLIKNDYFQDLPIPIITKILVKSDRLNISPDPLYIFITKSISERFPLLYFVCFSKLTKNIRTLDFKQIVISFFRNFDEIINLLLPDKKELINFLRENNQIPITSFYHSKLNDKYSDDQSELTFNFENQKEEEESGRYNDSNIQKSGRNATIGLEQPNSSKFLLQTIQQPYQKSTNSEDNRPIQFSKTTTTTSRLSNLSSKKNQAVITKPVIPSNQFNAGHGNRRSPPQGNPTQNPRFTKKQTSENELKKEDLKDYFIDNDSSDEQQYKPPCNHRPLSEDDKRRAKIWKDTEKILNDGQYEINGKTIKIKSLIDKSIRDTKTIRPTDKLSFNKNSVNKNIPKEALYQKVDVLNRTTFEAARKFIENDPNKKICVLNFASAVKPGGGVLNGRSAQEETLSRMSSLYWSLLKDPEMYGYNSNHYNPYYSDYMIFSPDVVVFRDDDYKLIDHYEVSVISSPAVNCKELKDLGTYNKDKVNDVMTNRCRRILEVCLFFGIKNIVLGAFGCGVFENRPEDVSEIFRKLIVDDEYGAYFDRIIFAIMSKRNGYTLSTFKEAFRK